MCPRSTTVSTPPLLVMGLCSALYSALRIYLLGQLPWLPSSGSWPTNCCGGWQLLRTFSTLPLELICTFVENKIVWPSVPPHVRWAIRGGRIVVECAGFENRRGASLRGFDSHSPRHFPDGCRLSACPAKRPVRGQTDGAVGAARRKFRKNANTAHLGII